MNHKKTNGKKFSESYVKGKNGRTSAAKTDNFRHQATVFLKNACLLFIAFYFMGGTLAMGIVYHQHKGHLINWLAGDESKSQKQASIQRHKAAEEAELEAECQASYHMSCTEYALSIAEAKQSNTKRDSKQIAMLEKVKNKARAM